MNELETALRSKLTGGTALTTLLAGTASVYNAVAPRGATYPYVTFHQQSGIEENDSPHKTVNMLYTVKGVSDASMTVAGDIDDEIDALFDNATLTVTGWTNYWTAREAAVRYVETTPEGEYRYHSGGVYRVRLAK